MKGLLLALALSATASALAAPVQVADLLANSPPADWRTPDPDNTLYLELPSGRVVIELAPQSGARARREYQGAGSRPLF
jgi:hypothetical protein